MLTGAAIYLVASDSMPKIGTVTLISRLYLSSLIHNFIALFITIFVVSLHNIVAADPINDHKLNRVFVEATGGEDIMDSTALEVGLHALGLREGDLEEAHIRILSSHASPLALTREDWGDIGTSVEADSKRATRHNILVAALFNWAEKRDNLHKQRMRVETDAFMQAAQRKRLNDISCRVKVDSQHTQEMSRRESITPRLPRQSASSAEAVSELVGGVELPGTHVTDEQSKVPRPILSPPFSVF